jgi:hypothetical protein
MRKRNQEGGEEAEWDAAEDAGGEGEESWDRGDWSQDHRGNWRWSVDFTKVKAADAALQQPAVDLAAIAVWVIGHPIQLHASGDYTGSDSMIAVPRLKLYHV